MKRIAVLLVLLGACRSELDDTSTDVTESAAVDPSLIPGQWVSVDAPEYVGFTVMQNGGYAIAHAYIFQAGTDAPGAEYEAGAWVASDGRMVLTPSSTACVDGAGQPFSRLSGAYDLTADGQTLTLTGPGGEVKRFERNVGKPFLPGTSPGARWGCYGPGGFTPGEVVEL